VYPPEKYNLPPILPTPFVDWRSTPDALVVQMFLE